ncbi:MAG: nucleoside-diphosphate kinase [Deltaproteobacteria bacterium]|nr:MAG: nucleoside-diphosphate kinase [Deltaproteobacteria bacterium]
MEQTLAMIKPDATARDLTGKILARIEEEGFKIVAMKRLRLSKLQAEAFYAVHRERPFFGDLTEFMSSGPIVAICMEREEAIVKWREVMGATNPENAAEGTLRKLYALDVEKNSCHGSDAPETAAVEKAFFFSGIEML